MMRKYFVLLLLMLQATCFGTYYGQWSQDGFIHACFFYGCRNGVFIDIGAHDGVTFSNTYFFEREMGWTGICVEPNPKSFSELKNNRNSICIEGCISDKAGDDQFLMISGPYEMFSGLWDKYDPRHLEKIERLVTQLGGTYELINVKCYLLNDILEKNRITHVNLLSIDTEGGEFEILSSIDFSRFQIDVIIVEDNYGDPRFIPFLSEKGFRCVLPLEQDLIFVNNNFEVSNP